ncbi:hypothetical protein BJX66DRAFT_349378 [Aspergillus keveii]|uniref:Uncharacterized protein n=1 Tax=Aspergillus keveii TaxID=714993 RepID=A0ABR4FJT3_9EURO
MGNNARSNPSPDWGQLPLKQYLIRRRLVHAYMQLEEIPKEWDPTDFNLYLSRKPTRIPTTQEITVILRPWWSDDLRRRAWEIWRDRERGPPVVLRTYYGNVAEGDDKFAEYIRVSENIDMMADWAALNDAELFNFGSDWRRIFSILSEVAGCREMLSHRPVQGIIDMCLPDVKGSIKDAKRANPHWRQDLTVLFEEGQSPLRSILAAWFISWIFIVDEHTFETDELLVVYLDMHQDVTIQGRLEVDQAEIDDLLLSRELGSPEGIIIDQGVVEDKYSLSTETGRKYFGLTKSDLEDSTTIE